MLSKKFLSVAGAAEPTDDYFKNVTMLLHGDGTNGAQNNTFTDSSSNNFTITRNGNTTQGSFSPYGDTWSNYFDGSGDYLDAPSNAAFGMGTGDFTIEVFAYVTAYPSLAGMLIDLRGGADPATRPCLEYSSTGTINYRVSGANRISGGTIPLNAWSHIALCRSSGVTKLYLNGTQVGSSYTDTNDYGSSSRCRIGADDDGSLTIYMTGYMTNVRIVKGTAVYTSTFTPPTSPLTAISGTSLLTCQSNRFIDNSSNAFAITKNGDVSVQRFSPFNPTAAYSAATIGGSGYFDGSGDYLSAPSNAAFAFGTSDFTVECWVYITGSSGIGFFQNASSDNCNLQRNTSGNLEAWDGTTRSSSAPMPSYCWHHVVFTRVGTAAKVFLNGVSVLSWTSSVNYGASGWIFGYTANGGNPMIGYIADARVLKGTGYSSITVPTAPLTAITNTSLLLSYTNAGIFDNAMMNDLETVGNAQISTSVKKYGTGSMAFDGSGDWLLIPYGPNMALQNTYTVEAWVYPANTSSGYRTMFMIEATQAASFGVFSLFQSGTTLGFEIRPATGAGVTVISGGTLTANTWQHVAISVSGTSGKLFLNGTQVGSTTTLPDYSFSVSSCSVGGHPNVTSEGFNGYIDDLRITKGVARYTSNFTAPTAALPNK